MSTSCSHDISLSCFAIDFEAASGWPSTTDYSECLEGPSDFFRLRKRVFVDDLGWKLSTIADKEMDLYDNELAIYCLVRLQSRLVAGARLHRLPSDLAMGQTLFADASQGRIAEIPADIFEGLRIERGAWDCTRFLAARGLTSVVRRQATEKLLHLICKIVQGNGDRWAYGISSDPMIRLVQSHGVSTFCHGKSSVCCDDGIRYRAVLYDLASLDKKSFSESGLRR